jgi:hypothetical protein
VFSLLRRLRLRQYLSLIFWLFLLHGLFGMLDFVFLILILALNLLDLRLNLLHLDVVVEATLRKDTAEHLLLLLLELPQGGCNSRKFLPRLSVLRVQLQQLLEINLNKG